jgi:orotidine-5'-phosphate decarboxylase
VPLERPPSASLLPDSRVVFALDFPSVERALPAALAVREAVGMLKVGLELFVGAGPAALAIGQEAGLPVFLDLKLHDIPETVERAVARAASLGARMLTVHASGGSAMLRRAVERASKEGGGLEIAAVTVLTSFDASDLATIGVIAASADVASQVERLARLAWVEGVRAFVCSPHEAAILRRAFGSGATLVTPGVRASASGADDQKRTMTAGEAVSCGADWVVVGRPIRDAADPASAARQIAAETRAAMALRRSA